MNFRIKEIRSTLEMSQTEFSQSLHMTPASISMIEAGKRPVTDRLIHNICNEFGVSEEWLRTGEGDMFPPPPEEDDALIEAFGMLTVNGLDPRRKRLARALLELLVDIPDDALPPLKKFFADAAAAMEEKKDED